MTTNNGDMPASPQHSMCTISGDVFYSIDAGGQGMTKREHFAAMAMQGILSSRHIGDFIRGRHDDVDVAVAEASLEHADALLKALSEDSSNE